MSFKPWIVSDKRSPPIVGYTRPESQTNLTSIQAFINCLLGGGSGCTCADTDDNAILDVSDVDKFVNDLLVGATCP